MQERKSFYLLAPCLTDSLLTKDIGILPYLMQKYRGYKAVYVTYLPSGEEPLWPSLSSFEEEIELEYIEPSFSYHPDRAMDTIFGANLRDCRDDLVRYIGCNATKIDVLYLFGFYPFYYDAAAKYKELNPSGTIYLKLDANIIWVNKTPMTNDFRRFLSHCDVISSETLAPYISDRWSVPVHHIPNGYYFFGKEPKLPVAFEEKSDYILTVGRLGIPEKATHVLLEAFRLAEPYIPASWKLVLVGRVEDSFQPYLYSYMANYPWLADRMILTGFVQDKETLHQWYRKSKIFALPSNVEAYAHVLAEAKIHGCYLLASDIACCRDAATKQEDRSIHLDDWNKQVNLHLSYGSLHAAGYSAGLAQRMIEICHAKDRLREASAGTQRDAAEHFDWVKICGRLDDLLRSSRTERTAY
ncbi:glycosyltransferase family 4 protein [Paenibacillus glycanilyticus]|uniref:glycosyltransferase family 4 protein n=1 Tax=Paenibacillus glycanilyticus TaxID=126569 RepID=UPI000FDCD0DE|nr:glycosyltransferase family 4 protein [Paenibacillus glycanilyticus]